MSDDRGPAIPSRRTAEVAAVLSALVLAVLAIRYTGVDGPGSLDRRLDGIADGLVRVSGTGDVLRPAVFLLGPLTTGVVCLLLAVACLWRGRLRLALLLVVAPAATGAATVVLQPLVARSLNGGDALPSGHTAAATCTALAVALAVGGLTGWRGTGSQIFTICVVAGLPAVMSLALIYNDLHVATDVVAGFCTALLVVSGTGLAIDRLADLSAYSVWITRDR